MPLFEISKTKLVSLEQTNFPSEKKLQHLVEENLGTIFNCRFVASEFPTGPTHGGRIDTLALSEDNNPVIIEYKKVESSELINQSLFYLAWINDHRGDYKIAVQQALGNNVKVDWSDVRVICIAPNYRKYDLHAVQVIGANIELWQYRYFKPGLVYLEEVFRKSYTPFSESAQQGKSPVMIAAGKKAAITRATGSYTFEQRLKNMPQKIQNLALEIQEYVMSLDPAMAEVPKKFYVAYKISQNIVCMVVRKSQINLYLKLDPGTIKNRPPNSSRDVTDIGHYGTGDFEILIKDRGDLETAKPFIEMAYRKVGG
ncbi:MAG: DUF5655 domain-containing protein [Planctomycetota bacterium]|nr:DUF5655 domain-containing protein [Planctomycetota bacterium]